MSTVLIDAFRYKRWANLHLLDICSTLDEIQLQLTTPGTYGTIRATLQHLLAAEQRYATRLAILGQHGVSVDDIDVWAYGEAHQGYEPC
jgi:uncharacterized damage-inducible protein DinB